MEEETFAANLVCDSDYELSDQVSSYNSFKNKDVGSFTYKITGMLKKMDYFGWILRNSHGVDVSTCLPDYLVWSNDSEAMGNDVCAIKKGNLVTFKHMPGHGWHNIMINTSQLLSQAATGYLLTNNELIGKVTEQYCKGLTATMKGMIYDKKDKEHYLMARNIIPESHKYVINGGLEKAVDYDSWRNNEFHWNAKRFNYPNNPYFGDIYVTNIRSKDDLPHIFRAAAFLPDIIANAKNKKVVNAAREAYEYIKMFSKDIVDNDFHIRTKDETGKAYSPKGDLANFITYGKFSEKNAIITATLMAYDDLKGLKPGKSSGGIYESIACKVNYFNYKIVNGFHMSAILQAFNNGYVDEASKMIKGLTKRADKLIKNHSKSANNPRWNSDLAVFLLKAASAGMPLNHEKSRIIKDEFSKAIDVYKNFHRWNLWNKSVPDGIYGSNGGYIPKSDGLVRPIDLGLFFEYAYSPYKAGDIIINPEIISNKKKW